MEEADRIDALLVRYLGLLDEYAGLRARLSGLQTAAYQSIARANFAAERGMRFGRDHYDDRMRATRRVFITTAASSDEGDELGGVPVFAVRSSATNSRDEEGAAEDETTADSTKDDQEAREDGEDASPPPSSQKQQKKKQQQQPKDPLRWFGLLAPQPLRQAQAQSVEAVEQVVPALASVAARMAQVEIEVRRARKRRAKAEAAAAKEREKEREIGGARTEVAA
ncbi:hypothetical protein GGR52DRAFT_568815 [Hypoxylon sp. FL1284]|nr:hypothetical protein GGR52DRAFT_568815 [Hypoxylon sp. FL1284]